MNGYCLRLAAWLCFGLGLCGWGQPPETAVVPGGTGTETDPYRISELGHLAWMSNTATDSAWCSYTLSNDIDATATKDWDNGAGFKPIGTEDAPFTGVFDGNEHVIRNLTINRPNGNNIGLFGVLGNGSVIRNLGMDGGEVTGDGPVGGLIGTNNGTVIQCYAAGTVTARTRVGGLVGYNYGTVTRSYAACAVAALPTTEMVEGPTFAGGLVGSNSYGWVANCYATGTVTSWDNVGGLVGVNHFGTVTRCYAIGAVTGYLASGLVGRNELGSVGMSYWDSETTGQTTISALGKGVNTAGMKQAATFAGWDWSVWGMIADGASYPYLRWAPPPFRVQVLGNGLGTTTAQASPDGTTLTVTATAKDNAEFARWEGCGIADPAATSTTVTMDNHKSIRAVFRTARGISTIMELQKIGNDSAYSNDGRYWLTQDVDATETADWNDGAGFKPIRKFTGVFDGNGHVIRNLTINRPGETNVGLFGVLGTDSELRNLGVEGGEVTGHSSVGGLVGCNAYGEVSRCYATDTVTGAVSVGGLVGLNNHILSQCHATGSVTAFGDAQRREENNNNSTIAQSSGGVIEFPFSSWSIGGVAGNNTGTISQCYATGVVNGSLSRSVGGLVGDNYSSGTINQCHATGAVTGSEYAGGLVGRNDSGTINQCYAAGAVAAQEYAGGLVGGEKDAPTGTVSQSYWDIRNTGQTTSAGGGTGVNTAKMKQATTFAGWDWGTVWGIAENVDYPYLQANIHTVPVGPDFVVTNLVITPELPAAGWKFMVAVTVKNQDTKPGKGGTLQLWLDKPAVATGGEKGDKAATISTLKPGQSRTVKMTLTAPNAVGTFTVRAFVDAQNATTETDETNNQATLSYRTGRPDFTIKSVSLSPATPAAGKTFTAYVTVTNSGEVAGNAGTLDAWADSSTLAAPPVPGSKTKGNKSKALGTLQPGQEKTITITGLKAPAATAAPVLGLLLDCRAKTPETDEGNNWLDFEYQCQ
jgi:hypothetical protein